MVNPRRLPVHYSIVVNTRRPISRRLPGPLPDDVPTSLRDHRAELRGVGLYGVPAHYTQSVIPA